MAAAGAAPHREGDMAEATPNSIHNLFGEALRETSDLAQKEFALLRTEMSQTVKTMFFGLAMVVAAAIFAIAAVILLTESLVEWLATVLESEALAALIVGGLMAAIAIGLGLYGRSAIGSVSLTPERTVRSVKRDTQVLTERVSG
jgi:F0F1-type ATP synthase membrane subunit c/vacuolar-type H+-ATPase subunit K